jgi:hypothetical protein
MNAATPGKRYSAQHLCWFPAIRSQSIGVAKPIFMRSEHHGTPIFEPVFHENSNVYAVRTPGTRGNTEKHRRVA